VINLAAKSKYRLLGKNNGVWVGDRLLIFTVYLIIQMNVQFGLSPLFRLHDHFPALSQESSGCYWKGSAIRHIWCYERTWCGFKACITVRVCAHSASPRQPHAWHKADRHRRTESQLQKHGFSFSYFFFLNQSMGGGRKIPFKTHSKFQLWVPKQEMTGGGGWGKKRWRRKFFYSGLYF